MNAVLNCAIYRPLSLVSSKNFPEFPHAYNVGRYTEVEFVVFVIIELPILIDMFKTAM